jgi:electron transfer flavoprotein-quinone oxidoreductase
VQHDSEVFFAVFQVDPGQIGDTAQLIQDGIAVDPHQTAFGAKEVIRLGSGVINERFGLSDGEGAAMLYYGYPTDGCVGEGFLYTNKDTVSIGVTVTLDEIGKSDIPVPQLLDRFKEHPATAPYLKLGFTVRGMDYAIESGRLAAEVFSKVVF